MTRFLACLLTAFLVITPVIANDVPASIVKDRVSYMPSSKQSTLPKKAIGLLVGDAAAILATEGRSGPPDQLVFSAGGNSYRWIYVPTQDKPLISQLPVDAGETGKIRQIYPALNMATPRSVAKWTVTEPYTLVEVEVNAGEGAPKGDSFVATKFRVVEGSREYPLRAADVIKDAKDRYAAFMAKRKSDIEQSLKETGAKALAGRTPTGPREKEELMYVTWMADKDALHVRFKTKISDGAYTVIGDDVPRPFPKGGLPKEAPKGMLRVAPPKNVGIKVGTTFGLELGRAYIFDKEGKLLRTEELAIETFARALNDRRGFQPGPVPLPLPKGPKL